MSRVAKKNLIGKASKGLDPRLHSQAETSLPSRAFMDPSLPYMKQYLLEYSTDTQVVLYHHLSENHAKRFSYRATRYWVDYHNTSFEYAISAGSALNPRLFWPCKTFSADRKTATSENKGPLLLPERALICRHYETEFPVPSGLNYTDLHLILAKIKVPLIQWCQWFLKTTLFVFRSACTGYLRQLSMNISPAKENKSNS